ncbi:hypothetical protein MFUR16E_00610 [Methylobacterium fujisawaense]
MSKSITLEDVRLCFRYILGREPESEQVLIDIFQNCKDFDQMRKGFIGSQEFQNITNAVTPGVKPIDWPEIRIDSVVDKDQLEALFLHIESNWQQMGQGEPHWSVLTDEKFKQDNINDNMDLFYDTSNRDVEIMKLAFERSGGSISQLKTCFELGCGVGRMTVALANIFEHVTAVDISEPHLKHAQTALDRRGLRNVTLKKLQKIDQLNEVEKFDLFYSIIVLQHNPPPVMRYMLDQIFSKIKSGGYAYFQIPTYIVNGDFRVCDYMSNMTEHGDMEMHPLPQHEIFDLLDSHGMVLREIREDNLTGNLKHISNTILAQRK